MGGDDRILRFTIPVTSGRYELELPIGTIACIGVKKGEDAVSLWVRTSVTLTKKRVLHVVETGESFHSQLHYLTSFMFQEKDGSIYVGHVLEETDSD